MYLRKIYPELEAHLEKKYITVLTGMRRVGKTTALKHVLHKAKTTNKIYLDLERIENRHLFNKSNYKDIELSLAAEGIDLEKPCVIALDEIQLVPNITSVIKYLYDSYKIKFLVTGSSSFYIKNHFTESLAGRKTIFEMHPLDFGEFLQFKEVKISSKIPALHEFNLAFYNKHRSHYEEYIQFGGFPEVVMEPDKKSKKEYLRDIINAYIELDIKLLSDFQATDDLYRLMKLIAARVGSKTDYSKISSLTGLHRQKVKDYFQLLEHTYFINMIPPFTKNADREISLLKKFYFSDTGILNELAEVNSGAVFENAIANQLLRIGKLNYYNTKSGQEIDFIVDEKTAVEVKESASKTDLDILNRRAESLKMKKRLLIGRKFSIEKFSGFSWGGSMF